MRIDIFMKDKNIIIEELKDYTYLFDFYVKHREELTFHSMFAGYLKDNIYDRIDELLRLHVRDSFNEDRDIDVGAGQWKFLEKD